MRSRQWDLFCRVIDNFGDIGVCWRLAAQLASRGQQVRLWVDDASALTWMAPAGCDGVMLMSWTQPLSPLDLSCFDQSPSEVLIEAFGCEPATELIAHCVQITQAGGLKPVWINLEYLSAEGYVQRSHGLPSPVHSGPATGWVKHFFYPGFTPQTGGLLRELQPAQRLSAGQRKGWLLEQGITWNGEMLVSLFCYEPPALTQLLRDWALSGIDNQPVRLLVTAGRAQRAVEAAMAAVALRNNDENGLPPASNGQSLLLISYLPLLSQPDFDELLRISDINFVRGEDSLVRALWAGKPFVWQIYCQDDGAHLTKLDAFLDMLDAPRSWRDFHHNWNRADTASDKADHASPPPLDWKSWQATVLAARTQLLLQSDLTSRLLNFVDKNR